MLQAEVVGAVAEVYNIESVSEEAIWIFCIGQRGHRIGPEEVIWIWIILVFSRKMALFAFTFAILLLSSSHTDAACANEANVCDGEGPAFRPLPSCQDYAQCESDQVLNIISCGAGTIYDVLLQRCNWENVSFCIVKSCSPSKSPQIRCVSLLCLVVYTSSYMDLHS